MDRVWKVDNKNITLFYSTVATTVTVFLIQKL